MDTMTLLLLGAAGGSLRALVEFYNHTMEWRTDRRRHRHGGPDAQVGETPRFRDYVDPWPDALAAAIHTALGAGAAAMLGSTGQINGAYAAIAVGISAPALLAQIGQVQGVSDAVAGPTSEPQQAVPPAAGSSSGGGPDQLPSTPVSRDAPDRGPGQRGAV